MAEISMKLFFTTSAIVLIGLFSIFAVGCSEDDENKKEDGSEEKVILKLNGTNYLRFHASDNKGET